MPTVEHFNELRDLALFRNLTMSELAQVGSLLHRKTFSTGTTLITAELSGEMAYLIITGTVKVYLEQADGTHVILAILGAGALVGELSLIEEQPRSANVVTLEPVTCYWIDRIAFQEIINTIPLIMHNLVRLLANRLRLANAQIQLLSRQDAFGRIAGLLLAFADEFGTTVGKDTLVPLRLTQSDLASMIGASRVRVNQVLGSYRERDILTVHPNYYITLHDKEALAAQYR